MIQSINFLRDLPKDSSRLSVTKMVWIVIGVTVFLFIISVFKGVHIYNARSNLNELQQTLVNESQTYTELVKKYPLLSNNISLSNQIQALRNQVEERSADYAALEHLIVRPGFSGFMYALAQTVPASLWFNQISINLDSDSITLGGYAVRPDDVSVLMNRLMKTAAFKKIVFNLFYVKAITNRPYVKFSIATDDLGSEDDSEDPTKTDSGGK
ncbi:PilN domain-containing protein [Legionella bononiensis]|uniref:PilN domain-containing protein n=1 Tax=Legionella bononiensis TaxID=2793102 RepID=A0ABS1WBD8_9GAMM|nr:PilN domain-containing protein [Legionella bononiensis]MBL7480966.1 PilN domain-containing protein [Legionella bononiensis]MBL7526674.1 PilN domain-containing protein [Legionella bononiensis]MBL7564081.1 PilN domain-containing protein [Legionella bononiensis]